MKSRKARWRPSWAVSKRAFRGISLFRETNSAKMEVVNGAQQEKGRQGRSKGGAHGRQDRGKGRVEARQGRGQVDPAGDECPGIEEVPVSQVRNLHPDRARRRRGHRAFEERRNFGRVLVLYGHYGPPRTRPREPCGTAGPDLG